MAKYKLGDICEIVSGSTPKTGIDEYWDGDIKWITPAELDETSYIITDSARKITELAVKKTGLLPLPKGTVILSSRAPIGKVAIAGCEMYCNQGFKNLICSDVIINKYLYWFLKANTAFLNSLGRGATFKEISKAIVSEIEINVPSLSEQENAVANLEKISQVVALRKQQLTLLDDLKKARFVELTEETETASTRMGDIATYLNGYAFKPTQWEETGLPIIRIQNLNDKNAPYNYFSDSLADRYFVQNGDVLVSWATHLEAYIWKGQDAWLNQHIFKVVFDKMEVDKIYFVYACEEALRQAFRNAHGFKPTMEHIKKADFDNAIVKLPKIEVQEQFADFVNQVDKSKLQPPPQKGGIAC